MGLKPKRYSADAYRIEDERGHAVYMALKLANGRWGAFDADDIRVNDVQYQSPMDVLDYFETLE